MINIENRFDKAVPIFASISDDIPVVPIKLNLFEALIGSMYLDGGIEPCRKLILDTVWAYKKEAWKATNYKGKLIEYCHSKDIKNLKFFFS